MQIGDEVRVKQRRREWYNAPPCISTPVDPRYKQVDTLGACTATVVNLFTDSLVVEHADGTLEECSYDEVETPLRKYTVKCKTVEDPVMPGCFTGIANSFFETEPELVEQTDEVETYEFTSEYDMDRILDLQDGVIEYEVQVL